MKRVLALAAVIGLVVLWAPSPAKAAPLINCEAQDGLLLSGLELCVSVAPGEQAHAYVNLLGGGLVADVPINLPIVEPIIERVVETVTVTVPGPAVPGPTVTVTPPRPAPATVTRTTTISPGADGTATVTTTQTQAPATVTESTSATTTATVTRSGQAASTSGTVSTAPTLAGPPEEPGEVNLLPDTPGAAAATGGLLGLFIGLICAFLLMFIAYRRGQAAGEEKSIQDFLGYLRGTPQPGRHRTN